MSAPQNEVLQPPTPFNTFYWTPELSHESNDRRKLVKLSNRTRSIASGVSTIIGIIAAQGLHDACGEARYLREGDIGALEAVAVAALEHLEDLASEYGDEVISERMVADDQHTHAMKEGA